MVVFVVVSDRLVVVGVVFAVILVRIAFENVAFSFKVVFTLRYIFS